VRGLVGDALFDGAGRYQLAGGGTFPASAGVFGLFAVSATRAAATIVISRVGSRRSLVIQIVQKSREQTIADVLLERPVFERGFDFLDGLLHVRPRRLQCRADAAKDLETLLLVFVVLVFVHLSCCYQ
jgi:hypothetical protein